MKTQQGGIVSALSASSKPAYAAHAPGPKDVIGQLSATKAPGRTPMPTPASIITRGNVKNAT